MKIGVFGGSFNPPHKMHFSMGEELLNKGYVDKVIYVPTGKKYEYKNNLVDDQKRFRMLEIMIKNDSRFMVSDFELKNKVVYTSDTLKHFCQVYPNDEIFFICGSDNLSYVDKWKDGEYLLKNYKFLVIKRKTDEIDEILKRFWKYKENIIVSDVKMNDISSTLVRCKLKAGDDVLDYVDKQVLEYIKENKLYM